MSRRTKKMIAAHSWAARDIAAIIASRVLEVQRAPYYTGAEKDALLDVMNALVPITDKIGKGAKP